MITMIAVNFTAFHPYFLLYQHFFSFPPEKNSVTPPNSISRVQYTHCCYFSQLFFVLISKKNCVNCCCYSVSCWFLGDLLRVCFFLERNWQRLKCHRVKEHTKLSPSYNLNRITDEWMELHQKTSSNTTKSSKLTKLKLFPFSPFKKILTYFNRLVFLRKNTALHSLSLQ